MTTKAATASYKKLLVEARELQGQSGLKAHRRASILVKLYDDADFRADIGAGDDFKVKPYLNELVEDLSVTFDELAAMLAEFPEETAWADGKLATLYSKAVEQIASRKLPGEETTKRVVNRVTQAEFSKVVGEKQDAEARLKFVEKQHTQSVSELDQLRRENAELRMELAKANGRIQELERMVERKLQVA